MQKNVTCNLFRIHVYFCEADSNQSPKKNFWDVNGLSYQYLKQKFETLSAGGRGLNLEQFCLLLDSFETELPRPICKNIFKHVAFGRDRKKETVTFREFHAFLNNPERRIKLNEVYSILIG